MATKLWEFWLKISYNSAYTRNVANNNARCTPKKGSYEVGQFTGHVPSIVERYVAYCLCASASRTRKKLRDVSVTHAGTG